ncbi:hypothetical protein GE09DRAFT_1227802 [Coniochaeta sp. 2T2.1]|nr:hypothetical protein GE09DRAFT_1227802 [Coniochaeta sp. 2T2.1]
MSTPDPSDSRGTPERHAGGDNDHVIPSSPPPGDSYQHHSPPMTNWSDYAVDPGMRLHTNATSSDWLYWREIMTILFMNKGVWDVMSEIVTRYGTLAKSAWDMEWGGAAPSTPTSAPAGRLRPFPAHQESSKEYRELLMIAARLIERAVCPVWKRCLREEGLGLTHPWDMWDAVERWCCDGRPDRGKFREVDGRSWAWIVYVDGRRRPVRRPALELRVA